jgi:chromosome segregation ATPase
MTIGRITPKRVDKAVQTTSQVLGVQTSILSNILPGHASVSDAITRLQRERDLALRRVDELHDHYKKELKKKDDADHTMAQWHKEEHQNQLRASKNETAQCKMQFEQARSLIETQKLSIKLLQDELGEEAEFDAEETAQMRSVRRECETRVNNYEDRMVQLQSDMQKDIDKQVYLLKKVTKERDDARNKANESQQSAMDMFNEQKRLESQMDRMKDEVSRSNKAVDKMRDEAVRLRSKVNDLQH